MNLRCPCYLVSCSQTGFFLFYGWEKDLVHQRYNFCSDFHPVWVGDDWCQQQLLKCVNFLSVHHLRMIECLGPRAPHSQVWSWTMIEFQQALTLDLLKSRFILKRATTQTTCTISFCHYNSASCDPSSSLWISWSLLAAQEVNTFKKLLLTPIIIPIITHPRLGGSLNRNYIVDIPDPFPAPIQKKKRVGLRETTCYLAE